MNSLQTLVKGDIDIFKNAIIVANGDEKVAKENLTEAIFDFARIISKRIFQNGFKVNPEYAVIERLDVANGFESERVAIIQEGNCFAVNKKGNIYSITKSNKYGFKKLKEEDILSLHGEQIGFLHTIFYALMKEVTTFHKK